MSVTKASSGIMYLVREMYRDVTHMETVEIPEGFFNMASIRHLMLGTGKTSMKNERVHALHENHTKYRFNGIRYRGDWGIYTYGAMKYITNKNNHMIVNLKRLVICAVFVLYPGLSPEE
jgi:hypothetical protein